MSWQFLIGPEVQAFIRAHADDDVKALGLKKSPDASWSYPLVLDQIKVRQKARIKSPDLYETDGFIFPPNDVYEQSSSQACAAYKASLVSGGSFADLTAGAGMDSFAFAKRCVVGLCVEKCRNYAEVLKHNASVVSDNIIVLNVSAEDFLEHCEVMDMVFIDPQRRDNSRKGLYDFSACSPDIVSLLPTLKQKARKVIIKASPFLDIERAVESLGCVNEVHVVQWRGECKEVLYVLDFTHYVDPSMIEITAIDLNDDGSVKTKFSHTKTQDAQAEIEYAMPQSFICEPGPAFQKAGGLRAMGLTYGLKKLHPNTQLFTCDEMMREFPGKVYEVVDIVPVQAKSLPVKKADLCVRNFPADVKLLRKKLKLGEGGDARIYAVTLMNEDKRLIICKKG